MGLCQGLICKHIIHSCLKRKWLQLQWFLQLEPWLLSQSLKNCSHWMSFQLLHHALLLPTLWITAEAKKKKLLWEKVKNGKNRLRRLVLLPTMFLSQIAASFLSNITMLNYWVYNSSKCLKLIFFVRPRGVLCRP